MQVLTPSGYVDILDLNIGDEVIAYDINTGAQIINHLEGKTLWTPDMYPPDVVEGHYDENGDWIPPVTVRTSYEVFQAVQGDWITYRVNDTWNLYKDQSVWANMNVIHAKDLQIGDIVYNDQDGDVVVTSIEVVEDLFWWKLDVSGDSSYIADDLTLHNASRYWVGGGSSTNWNATGNTNWSASTGGANNASIPTSADVANFDGLGNSDSVISAIITIGGLIITSAYTSTMTHNADLTVAGSITLGANYIIAGTAALIISAACTFTSNGKTWPNSLVFITNTTTTLVGNLTINGLWEAVNAISPTINNTTTETVTCAGGIRISNNSRPTGTAKHIATGGTLDMVGTGAFRLPLDINGNITLSTFTVEDKAVNYISGTVSVVAGSTFYVGGSAILNLAGIVFNNFSQGNPSTYATFTSSIIVNGLLSGFARWNKTSSETITVYGGITAGNNFMLGTMPVICKGGTILTGSNSGIGLPLTLDGNITFASSVFYSSGNTLKYLSGTNNASTTRLYITATCSLDVGTLTWNGVTFTASGNTITLLSDLISTGISDSTYGHTMNRTTSEKFYTAGITSRWPDGIKGTATIQLTGGTWTATLSSAFISSNLEINGNLIISGNVYYQTGTLTYISGTVTAVSGGTLILNSSTQTLAFNAGANMQVPITIAGGTKTLSTDFSTGGLITISGATIINKTTSEVFTYGGGLTMSSTLGGTATVNLTGGTWSGASTLSSPLNINGNVTISGNVYYGTGTITYVSGTPIVTGSTLNVNANTTFNTGVMRWNNITMSGGAAHVLTSDLYALGAFTTNVGGGSNTNTSNGSKFYIYGGATGGNQHGGNVTFVMRGGVFSFSAYAGLMSPVEFDGDVTFQTSSAGGSYSITYVSGNVNTAGSTLSVGSGVVMNTRGILWNNVVISQNNGIMLTSDMFVNGLLSTINLTSVNKTTNEVLYARGGYSLGAFYMIGNGIIALQGGTWSGAANTYTSSLTLLIDGDVRLGANANIGLNGTLAYKSGRILSGTLNVLDNFTINDFHKCPITNVIVTAGRTVTMNQFFTGTPQKPASITASTAAGQYTVAFTDSFERVATNVITSGCVLSRPQQLIVSSSPRVNTLRTTNSGIRYNNQSPNGFSKNTPAVTGLATGPALGLAGDPCFIKQS